MSSFAKHRTGIGYAVLTLSLALVVLAAGFAYYYSTTAGQASSLNGQLSTLRASGRSYCETVDSAVTSIQGDLYNVTETLQQQVQSDNAAITSLNSTKPAGYQEITATLSTQIAQDLALISRINNLAATDSQLSGPPTFCQSVTQASASS